MVSFPGINNATSTVRGRGIVRKLAGSAIGAVGNAVVNAIAKSISGGSYRYASGRGTKKPRVTKKACGSGVRRVKRVVRRRRRV